MVYNRCFGSEIGEYNHPNGKENQFDLCDACWEKFQQAESIASCFASSLRWPLYAGMRDDHFEHFYPSEMLVRMCGEMSIFKVELMLDDNGPYWGWLYSYHPSNRTLQGTVSMIYRVKMAVEICFAYGSKAETKRGRGRIVRLNVKKC